MARLSFGAIRDKAAIAPYGPYAENNPVNLTDATGECPWCAGAAAGAIFDIVEQVYRNGGKWSCLDWGEVSWSAAAGAVGGQGLKWFKIGKEFKLGKNIRIAPFGNRTGHKYGELPHYHRRGTPGTNGEPSPGQGIKRHRPWEPSPYDRTPGDRF